ncbi:MAG: NAD(P)/FAD-dependent oxidoreductase [Lachnospiraceae bacterium]|nr:NAD(P)/FAD-dependent oxidoreductase [Lachnospiraceae bacterium]
MKKYDVIIIGAGVLGCFLARSLRRYRLSVLVLEKADDVCTGISRGGSGIIYAGYDMKPGTRKARMTTDACIRFPELCRTLGVKYRNPGSLIVSFGENADRSLRDKLERGMENGVPGLRLLDRAETLAMEPLLSENVSSALYAPGTCTVDPWELGIAAYENAVSNGARFVFEQAADSIVRRPDGFSVTAAGNEYACRILVNCAGTAAGDVHELISEPSVRIRKAAADYIVLEDNVSPAVSHVLFHETEDGSKGLTLIPTAHGNMMIGQTERETDAPGDPTDQTGLSRLRELCREVVPGLPADKIMRTFAINRPNPYSVKRSGGEWVPAGKGHFDFSILEEDGFFSLIGVKTPGLTCSNELAEDLTDRILAFLGDVTANPAYDPVRKRPIVVSELSAEERDEVIKRDPAYGRIVCTCRDISEGEIRDAVKRGARTLKGIKYRTGAMMGNCQGSRCMQQLLNEQSILFQAQSGS